MNIPELKVGSLNKQSLLNDFNKALKELSDMVQPNSYMKTYIAFVSQTDTNNPTATTLQNNLGLINYTRVSVGTYTINSSGLFTLNKTLPLDDIWIDQNNNTFLITYIDQNTLSLVTRDSSNQLSDNILNRRAIYLSVF